MLNNTYRPIVSQLSPANSNEDDDFEPLEGPATIKAQVQQSPREQAEESVSSAEKSRLVDEIAKELDVEATGTVDISAARPPAKKESVSLVKLLFFLGFLCPPLWGIGALFLCPCDSGCCGMQWVCRAFTPEKESDRTWAIACASLFSIFVVFLVGFIAYNIEYAELSPEIEPDLQVLKKHVGA